MRFRLLCASSRPRSFFQLPLLQFAIPGTGGKSERGGGGQSCPPPQRTSGAMCEQFLLGLPLLSFVYWLSVFDLRPMFESCKPSSSSLLLPLFNLFSVSLLQEPLRLLLSILLRVLLLLL
jgi:hypothetical protein